MAGRTKILLLNSSNTRLDPHYKSVAIFATFNIEDVSLTPIAAIKIRDDNIMMPASEQIRQAAVQIVPRIDGLDDFVMGDLISTHRKLLNKETMNFDIGNRSFRD